MHASEVAQILLVRAVEETQPELAAAPEAADADAAASAQDAEGEAAWVARRGTCRPYRLDHDLRGYRSLLQLADAPHAPGVALLIPFALGALANSLGPAAQIHVLYNPIAVLVAWNLGLYALLILGLIWLPSDLSGWPRLSIHVLLTALLASCVVREDHGLAALCAWKPVARIGVLSYGLYLWHLFALDPAARLVARGLLPPALLFPATLIGSVLIAECSYRLFETRFLKLKHRFAR